MKKLLTFLAFGLSSLLTHAQSVSVAVTQAACNNDGILTATFSGLTPPLTVTWTLFNNSPVVHTGVTTSDVFNNYTGGEMYVTVVDANSQYASDYIFQPPFTYSVSSVLNTCPTPNVLTATVTGGTGPFSYVWYDKNTLTTMSTTNPASLQNGNYGILITDANGCVFGSDYVYDSIQAFGPPTFSFPVTSTPASCTNGTATVGAITGGTPPYSYLWNNSATTSSISGLMQGSYNVVVTDASGCSVMGNAFLQQSVQINANTVVTPATCTQNDGAVTAFGSGGVPPYSYLWNTSATTSSITGLSAGWYSLTVTDANGCIGYGYANVNASTPITATYTTTASSCTAPTGSATLSISGGTPPYTTTWNTLPVQTGVTASGLPAGNYGFVITDAVGCIRTGTASIPPVNIITGSFAVTSPSCVAANGALTVYPSGGTAPYTYSWNNSATSQTVSGLAAGYYSVSITDANGCTANKYQNLYATTPISLGFNTTQASCIFTNDGSVTVTPSGGTGPYTYSWSNGGNTATITGLADGNYWVNVTDANGCTKSGHVYVPYNTVANSCYCTVQGVVYHDVNNNCTQDAGELGIENIQMHLSGIGYVYTDDSGRYSFKVPTGSYTLSETVQSFYPLSGCQSNAIAVNATASSGCVINNDFGNTINPIHSMHVSSWHYNPPVPGMSYNLNTIISNEGTVSEATIIAGFKSDPQIMSPVFAPSGLYGGGTGDWYNITSGSLALNPAQDQAILKSYTVPTNVPLGTALVFKDSTVYAGPMSNWTTDYTPWNNVGYYQPVVVGSYDPNFKEVSPKGAGSAGTIFPQDSVLEYMIHFQNLGTWYANKVVVIDTLDSDLDITTLKPIYTSHPCVVTMTDNGIVTFTFDNIHLPAAVQDELLSNGMITYSIETKPNLTQGTQFTNSAAIYFDFNAPVITNTTLNTLGWPLDVNNTASSSVQNAFSLYPNPANNMFYAMISSESIAKGDLTLVDVSGKVIISKSLAVQQGSQAVPVDVSSLSPGIYFVTYSANGKKSTQKLVVIQ